MIVFLPKSDNWWGPAGKSGPCGPDTEMFYWVGKGKPIAEDRDSWMEIWNDVFMQFNKSEAGEFTELSQKNVDTGMGVERTLAALQGKEVFQTDSFLPIIGKIEELSGKGYSGNEKAMRIIADHLKAAVFLLAEKVTPARIERGYVLRRLIRRAIRYGKELGISGNFTVKVAESVFPIYRDYEHLEKGREFILGELAAEEERFSSVIEQGIRYFEKIKKEAVEGKIDGKSAFLIYQSYGFPIEMTEELAREAGLTVDRAGFDAETAKHQELSRTASSGIFKSGLADNSVDTTRLHTATHLLHAALRKVLGEKVEQRGSNITPERLRFDFSFDRKMTDEELKEVEAIVNQNIGDSVPVKREEMSPADAKASGAMGLFGEKYGEKVSVYTIEGASKEICSGPHVTNTKELGKFKIVKEEASSRGVRRIKAILEK
jgi:alanyl-tRNA synthetase